VKWASILQTRVWEGVKIRGIIGLRWTCFPDGEVIIPEKQGEFHHFFTIFTPVILRSYVAMFQQGISQGNGVQEVLIGGWGNRI
jgi:hypothetical protein